MKRLLLAGMLSSLCALGNVTYSVTSIALSDPSGNLSVGGLSSNGQYAVGNVPTNGFIAAGGATSTFSTPGSYPQVVGVNDSGTAVGSYYPDASSRQAFSYTSSGLTLYSQTASGFTTSAPNDPNYKSSVVGIDNAGDVAVNFSYGSDWHVTPVVFKANGSIVNLNSVITNCNNSISSVSGGGYLTVFDRCAMNAYVYNITTGQVVSTSIISGAGSGEADGVSDNGFVTGTFNFGSAYQAILYNGTSTTNLGSLVANAGTTGRGVNTSGTVVGEAQMIPYSGTLYHAFVYSGGVMSDLNNLLTGSLDSILGGSGWYLSSAQAISNTGVILAKAIQSGSGLSQALLLSPNGDSVPEPATAMLLGAGLGLMTLRAARKRRQAGGHGSIRRA